MNINKCFILFLLVVPIVFNSCSDRNSGNVKIAEFNTVNTLDQVRADEVISVPIASLNADLDESDNLIAKAGNTEIPLQLFDENGDEYYDALLLLVSYNPHENIPVSIFKSDSAGTQFKSRVYAELAVKENYDLIDGKYENGVYKNIDKITVPGEHTDHDNLFKYEGPGWESDKVGYRFYLDWRNTIDIFGKKTDDLILSKVGRTDLTIEEHSYHKMSDWGMDIFKVGNSLGVGSIATYVDGKVVKVSKTDSVICTVSDNGPILAAINTGYFGWKIGNKSVDLNTRLSITAGSRLTRVDIQVSDDVDNITTGLAKNDKAPEFIRSNHKGEWQYISIYGEQSLANDNLGIVVFYDENNFVEHGEDDLNQFVVLKPIDGFLTYYFAAVWEQEMNGIDNRADFIEFMQQTKHRLNSPVIIENN